LEGIVSKRKASIYRSGRPAPALLRVEPLPGKPFPEQIGVRSFSKAEYADAVAAWGEVHTAAETMHRLMVLSGALVGTDRHLVRIPPVNRPR
jgi:hypothetical protein